SRAMPALSDQRHDLVAIDHGSIFVDDDNTVSIAIERDANIGTHFMNLLGQAQRVRGAAILVDVETVWLVIDGDHFRAQLPKSRWSHLVACTIGAIDDDAQTRERH